MKKAYKILISRYPTSDGLLENPEPLNKAYETIHTNKDWTRISKLPSDIFKNHSSEDYVRGLNFAKIIRPQKGDVVSIELGTQLSTADLEKAVKDLDLPFDLQKVRHEE